MPCRTARRHPPGQRDDRAGAAQGTDQRAAVPTTKKCSRGPAGGDGQCRVCRRERGEGPESAYATRRGRDEQRRAGRAAVAGADGPGDVHPARLSRHPTSRVSSSGARASGPIEVPIGTPWPSSQAASPAWAEPQAAGALQRAGQSDAPRRPADTSAAPPTAWRSSDRHRQWGSRRGHRPRPPVAPGPSRACRDRLVDDDGVPGSSARLGGVGGGALRETSKRLGVGTHTTSAPRRPERVLRSRCTVGCAGHPATNRCYAVALDGDAETVRARSLHAR